jgi:hypothetical protein
LILAGYRSNSAEKFRVEAKKLRILPVLFFLVGDRSFDQHRGLSLDNEKLLSMSDSEADTRDQCFYSLD